MTAAGLTPIELERYSSSNKIWMTKVKRLRLPDLLCVASGLRVEVRAKSDLAIRMSDAPDNPQRRWFSGLNGQDLIAFVHCKEENSNFILAQQPELFWVRDLQVCSENQTRLGPAKSASEGSERDREWPTIVPSKDGEVLGLTATAIQTRLEGGRAQTYQRRNLNPYVSPGERFVGEAQFIAGLPARKASFSEVIGQAWDPRQLLASNEIDRYVAAKALGVSGNRNDFASLRGLLQDADARVALEAAGSLAKLGDPGGIVELAASVMDPRESYLRMEAVFLLSELRNSSLAPNAAEALSNVASNASFAGDEVRQAAIWGIGRAGLMAYERLLPYLDAEDENERVHAMVAFAPQLPEALVRGLTGILADQSSSERQKASSAYVLSMLTDVNNAVTELITIARTGSNVSAAWAKAVLGSLPADATAQALNSNGLLEQIRPLQMLSPRHNWTKVESVQMGINFVRKQTVFP
jgi:HEAT repeat protein